MGDLHALYPPLRFVGCARLMYSGNLFVFYGGGLLPPFFRLLPYLFKRVILSRERRYWLVWGAYYKSAHSRTFASGVAEQRREEERRAGSPTHYRYLSFGIKVTFFTKDSKAFLEIPALLRRLLLDEFASLLHPKVRLRFAPLRMTRFNNVWYKR